MKTTHHILKTALLIVATVCTAQADDHKPERKEHHNYIIERQQVYSGLGVPTSRLIRGKREIDIYRNGMMFEGNNLVGKRQDR
jgi:hypothetical protein